MNLLERYLTFVPFPVLLALLAVVCVVVLFIPPRLRLPLGIFALPIWLTLAQAMELGMIHIFATATLGLLYLYIALAALLDVHPKRSIPPALWGYPLLGMYSLFLCMTTVDRVNALVIQSHWVLLTVTAILVARTIVDSKTLHRLLYPLSLGIAVALLIPLADLIVAREGIFRRVGRFFPWGANPNQMGLLFSMAIPLALYYAIAARNVVPRVFWSMVVAIAGSLALLTASRSVVFVPLIMIIPLVIALTKRPVAATVVISVIAGAAMYVLRDVGGRYERFTSLESARWRLIGDYMDVIFERPLTGLLGTTGEHFMMDQSIGGHMHNAYLWILYQGGFPYFFAYLALMGFTGYCAFRVWRNRRRFDHDPLLTSLLVFSTIAIYAHGFVNMSIYYATYLFAFWHLVLSATMIAWAGEIKVLKASSEEIEEEPEDSYYGYEGGYGSEDEQGRVPAY